MKIPLPIIRECCQFKSVTASPMLAKPYDFLQDPKGWMISEKFDGIRAVWDGVKLTSRNGVEIAAPAWFTAGLPAVALDGELWLGRGKFQATLSEVNSGRFAGMKFMVFDAPEMSGGFLARSEAIPAMLAGCVHALPVVQIPCKNRKHFRESFQAIVAAGGEGVVIRNPSAKYVSGRSSGFQKLKKEDDDEGVMLGHDGRAMILDWQGKKIRLPMTSDVRKSPPEIGVKITFKFNGLTDSGIPRHASFVAVRNYE